MPPSQPRLRVLSVGGNAVSAFLSWRLSATNACDVTLVWKSNFQAVAQYGVSFKSKLYGNERFKPRYVVQSPEDAASNKGPAFDYVLLCVKALPDVYNLADIIQTVVTPQHTCILVNTTNTLGVEKQLEQRFPTNVVLSLVSGAALTQLGSSEFEHSGSTEIWVGPASLDSRIPQSIQRDMSEALAMTLNTGQVDCKVSENIRQQQYERMIGPVAFHPTSVLFETPDLAVLVQKPGVRDMISAVIDEMLQLAEASRCQFPLDFKDKMIEQMTAPGQEQSTMYQDFMARRPMEIETYLGIPCQLAKSAGIPTPRLETLYTILRHINITNKDRVVAQQPAAPIEAGMPHGPPARMMSNGALARPPPGLGQMNGRPMPMRPPPNGMAGPPRQRGPPSMNGYRGGPNGYGPRAASQLQRQQSFDDNNLDEFSHVMLYNEMAGGDGAAGYEPASNNVGLRERELMLREKQIRIREQEMAARGRGGRRQSNRQQAVYDDDDDEDGFDPADVRPRGPPIDPDNFDMMSVTSRRTNKRTTSQGQLRKNVFEGGNPAGRPGMSGRPGINRHRTSAQLMNDMPVVGMNIMDNPMMGFASNRYGNVDRKELAEGSRANSLTANKLQEMGAHGGPYPAPSRRGSRSPGNPLAVAPGPGAPGRPYGRPSPPQGEYGDQMRSRPSPPHNMQAPVPRYPPGVPNGIMPAHVMEQQAGVSKPFPQKPTKSLTGSASASAGSGDSESANTNSDPSAHSSTSSFAPRVMMSAAAMRQ